MSAGDISDMVTHTSTRGMPTGPAVEITFDGYKSDEVKQRMVDEMRRAEREAEAAHRKAHESEKPISAREARLRYRALQWTSSAILLGITTAHAGYTVARLAAGVVGFACLLLAFLANAAASRIADEEAP